MQNHFELFNLPQRFEVDLGSLDSAYREVQARVHPDRYVTASDAEKRVAMQWATRANEAYQVLKNPHKRAAYLCELNGVPLDMESNTSMPMAFLMEQMAWREALAEARAAKDLAGLEDLDRRIRIEREVRMTQIAEFLEAKEFEHAAQGVRALMFIDKFSEELRAAFDAIDG